MTTPGPRLEGAYLEHFRVLAPLGAGGMGEVWKATDTRLGRQVALKLLPSAFVADPVRLGRFEREARVLAALNHPSIASIYSFESAPVRFERAPSGEGDEIGDEPIHFLVMEHVQGESLDQYLHRLPDRLPLAECLRIGLQLCQALEAAHEQGIIHRDLKPANLMVDDRGGLKVLDFGLAKALSPSDTSSVSDHGLSDSPTLSLGRTREGAILGTAAYMSPEQANGRSVDKRTDIWSFGVVLWEMLTGGRLFSGASFADTLADVLRAPIPLERLPPDVPARLRELLRRCLERDPHRRLHDIADARLVLQDLVAGEGLDEPTPSPPRRSRLGALAVAAIVGMLLGALGVTLFRPRPHDQPSESIVRFEIPTPDSDQAMPSLSPDGERIAYSSQNRLWIRELAKLEPGEVEGGDGGSAPFWSPDGTSLGFFAERALWRLPRTGGRPTQLTGVPPGISNAGIWLPDDRILFTTGDGGVSEISARGGEARVRTAPLEDELDFHGLGALSANAVLVAVHHRGSEEYGNVTVLEGERRIVLAEFPGETVLSPLLAPGGWVLFDRIGINAPVGVWGVPIDLDPPRATGEPMLVAEAASRPTVRGDTLVYTPSGNVRLNQLAWVGRDGTIEEAIGDPRMGLFPTLALSPDRARAVVSVAQRLGAALWIVDLATGSYQQATFEVAHIPSAPVWSSDGDHLYAWMPRASTEQRIVRKRADSSIDVDSVTPGDLDLAISPDGRVLVFSRSLPGFQQDLWIRDLETGDESAIATTADWDRHPDFSPDGRFLAFVSSGDVVVSPFPPDGRRWQIARGGDAPRWGSEGHHLYFLQGETLLEVAIDPGPPFRASAPEALFTIDLAPPEILTPTYDVDGEGERFLMVVPSGRPPGLIAVKGWRRALDSVD